MSAPTLRLVVCGLLVVSSGLLMAQLPEGEVIVRPSQAQGWLFINEGAAGQSAGAFDLGPGTPPLGGGSATFSVSSTAGGMSLQFFDPQLVGLRLDQLTRLEYCTYVDSAPGPQAVALQINFDNDVTDADTSWKGRMVFEPANNSPVVPGTWQCWDTLNGNWWGTGAPLNGLAPISSPKSLATILTAFPNAGFNSNFGGILLKAGSGWASFEGAADALTMGIDGQETTFNFESEPASKEECKKGGWVSFDFRNQGQCVAYFNRNVK